MYVQMVGKSTDLCSKVQVCNHITIHTLHNSRPFNGSMLVNRPPPLEGGLETSHKTLKVYSISC